MEYAHLDTGYWILDTEPWILDPGYWTLVTGVWLLVPGYWTLVTGAWLLDPGYGTLDTGPWILYRALLQGSMRSRAQCVRRGYVTVPGYVGMHIWATLCRFDHI